MRSRYSAPNRAESMPLLYLCMARGGRSYGRRQLHRFLDHGFLVRLELLAPERREQVEERIRKLRPHPGELLHDRPSPVRNVSRRVAPPLPPSEPAVSNLL